MIEDPQTLPRKKNEQIKEAEERLIEHACKHARENPVSSLGIVLASGFIVSRQVESHRETGGSACFAKNSPTLTG